MGRLFKPEFRDDRGADLGPAGAAPTFTIYALKDSDGAHLDRIQIIKGWVDGAGELLQGGYTASR